MNVQKKNRANTTPLEEQEQVALVQYLEIKGLKFTAIANSTYTTSWKQKNKNKRMGLRSGLPDLVIIKNNKLIFIELKRLKGSTTSDEQIAWIEALQKCQNVFAKICFGADEAVKFIESV